jgi:phospholipase/carboxylesterase
VDVDRTRTLVVLHGHGSGAADAFALAEGLDPHGSAAHLAPNGPLVLRGGERAWFHNGDAASIRAGAAVVRDAIVQAGPGPLIVGWSQGGAAALAALATDGPAPGIAGLVLLGSFLADAPDLDYDLTLLAGVPVLIQHGRHDDVVPAFFAADLAVALADAGALVDHREVPLGHELDAAAIAEVAEWLRERSVDGGADA